MRAYVIRRLLLVIPTILIASFIIFIIQRLVPGDIVDLMIQEGELNAELTREVITRELGLDAPLFVQYGRWMGVVSRADGTFSGILQGNFGNSLWSKLPVTSVIFTRMPVTIELGILAIIVAQLIALPIGIYSALRQDTWGDYIARSFAILCISVPGFWMGTMIIVFPSIWWGYAPSVTYIALTQDPIGNLKMMIVPAVVLGMAMSGLTMRMTRTMMLEVMRQDYVRTAWAKGLKERTVIYRHALKNALIPVITIIGFQLPVLIGGTVIIEQIFCLPGMGRLIVNATFQRDYTLLSGAMLFFGFGLVFVNLIVDLTYSYLDPRVQYK